jgi:hypothetical protein
MNHIKIAQRELRTLKASLRAPTLDPFIAAAKVHLDVLIQQLVILELQLGTHSNGLDKAPPIDPPLASTR